MYDCNAIYCTRWWYKYDDENQQFFTPRIIILVSCGAFNKLIETADNYQFVLSFPPLDKKKVITWGYT